ncbi:MAG: Flp family type IVb pilin [Myxococcota bacterium]
MLEVAKRFISEEEGQTATEYMLIVSVIVVAVVAAAYVFIEPFQKGVQNLANDVKTVLSGGFINGQGVKR